jgi:hypothetical protein
MLAALYNVPQVVIKNVSLARVLTITKQAGCEPAYDPPPCRMSRKNRRVDPTSPKLPSWNRVTIFCQPLDVHLDGFVHISPDDFNNYPGRHTSGKIRRVGRIVEAKN